MNDMSLKAKQCDDEWDQKAASTPTAGRKHCFQDSHVTPTGGSNLSPPQYLLFSGKPHWTSKTNNYSLKIISHY